MIDIRFIRENPELVEEKAKAKGYEVDIKKLLQADDARRELINTLESSQQLRNEHTAKNKGRQPNDNEVAEGKKIREQIDSIQMDLNKAESTYNEALQTVPNIFSDDTPLGGEENNKEIKTWGNAEKKQVQDHQTWAESRGLVDFERGAKVAGNKFYYLKAGLVELEMAILNYALDYAKKQGYWLMGMPHLVNTRTLEGAGFSAKGKEKQVYKIEGEDLNLIATAEIPLTGYFADEILPNEWTPSRMAGWSPSYRMESGAYGKHSRGLFRVHQFNKVELYVLCKPEESEDEHQRLLKIEEEICQDLEIPYRVVQIAAGDLGAPAYKKYDVEYWSPAEGEYRELMSASNCTDYQSRNLNIRHKTTEGKNEFVHTLNATAAATSRMMVAIIENFQTKDGKVAIPKVLQPYMHGQTEL